MTDKHCDMTVMFRYTWPGRDEVFVCFAHAAQAVLVASAMGFHLQIHQVDIDDMVSQVCSQKHSGSIEDGAK